tara:strand:- start:437 stop:871 length:435 start_codon:yes stop_codon:yes gene_type:complete
MKKLFLLSLLIFPLNLLAIEKTKEEKVAKYIIENIQKDYVACYSFYKVSAAIFKKNGKEKSIIESLENSADVTLKFNHDLGEVLGLKPATMTKKTKQEVEKFTKIGKKDFKSLVKKYGLMCKNLVENQKQRIDYWEKEGNRKIK